jgi:hypothetical protein
MAKYECKKCKKVKNFWSKTVLQLIGGKCETNQVNLDSITPTHVWSKILFKNQY